MGISFFSALLAKLYLNVNFETLSYSEVLFELKIGKNVESKEGEDFKECGNGVGKY